MAQELADEAVVVEGLASRAADPPALEPAGGLPAQVRLQVPRPLQPVFTVHPRVVFGIIEREEQFTTTASRWVFPG